MTNCDPIYMPRPGDMLFKVCVYNAEVRKLVKCNEHHCLYDDTWAEEHCQQVCAQTCDEARELASLRYPPGEGFVITDVIALAAA